MSSVSDDLGGKSLAELTECPQKQSEAAKLVGQGFSVIALKSGAKDPAFSWKDFQTRRADVAEVTRWLTQDKNLNLGIVTGSVSGIVVLDVDDPKGGQKSIAEFGPLPNTPTVRTGRGRHYYFQHPGCAVPNRVDVLSGVDIRGDRGYVVAPPSIHPNGQIYKWEIGFDDASLAPLPDWLISLLKASATPSTSYGVKALAQEYESLCRCPDGKRNDSLNVAACKVGGLISSGEIAEHEARKVLFDACEKNSLVVDDGAKSVQATINSGLNKGKQTPRARAFQQGGHGELTLIKASTIQPQAITWLWQPVLPKGKLAILAGDPGVGKSHAAISIAATVTIGGKWPATQESCDPGNVLIISAEDDAADTIVPRLIAAGANLDKVFILDTVKDDRGFRMFDLNLDLNRLKERLEAVGGASLIIIDPITAYLGKADANNNGDVRGILARLAQLADDFDTCVLAVSHPNKDAGKRATYRITGSLGFTAAARAVYLVEKDPSDPAMRLMAPIKNNVALDTNSYRFGVEAVIIENGIKTSRAVFEDAAYNLTADELLVGNTERGESLRDAGDFLEAMLSDGPIEARAIEEKAQKAGIAERTLRRAKKKLQIKSCRHVDRWCWELPTPPL